MTEKRFELAYEKDNWWAVRDGDITLWKEEVIYLLNELAEENEFLKCRIDDYKSKVESNQEIIEEQFQGYKKLEEENKKLKLQNGELLYQIGEVGKNNKTCRECECFIPKIKYCYMWDMEVEADDVVVACDQRNVKNTKEMMSNG